MVGEYDALGAGLRTYGWAPQLQWGTDPFFVKIGSQYYWYQNDHQGTPQIMIDANETVTWKAVYKPFDEAEIVPGSASTNDLRFPGQYFDTGTRLYYSYHRDYYQSIGRYLAPDPIGIEYGTNHLYGYVMNNPIRKTDPNRLQGTIEVPAKLSRDLPAELLGMAASKTVGALTGVRCAQDYCKKESVPTNKMTGPYAECFRIFTGFRLPAGVAPFTMSDEFIRECADECWEITHKTEIKEVCGICDKDR